MRSTSQLVTPNVLIGVPVRNLPGFPLKARGNDGPWENSTTTEQAPGNAPQPQSLMAQRLDWIELGRAARRKVTEDYAHSSGEEKSKNHDAWIEYQRHLQKSGEHC